MDGVTQGVGAAKLVCHCLLIETNEGLVLVDTGLGTKDVNQPRPRLAEPFLDTLRPRLWESETALRQIEMRGFKREDVRHIVLTHLDFDHAGGISDFPNATVHLLAAEYQAAQEVHSLVDVGRYRPAQWAGFRRWKRYEPRGEKWFGFEAVRELQGLPPEILLIPLVGHTWGHTGVAVRSEHGWLLHAGDAYFYHEEMHWKKPHCTPGLALYQKVMEVDRGLRLWNQERLRTLNRDHNNEVKVFSAHDRIEFEIMMAGKAVERSTRPYELPTVEP